MNGKINVIMGIYNCEDTLKDSIESIIKQTYKNWNFIICDDGSIDNSYKIALEYEKKYPKKFIVLKNEKNMGLNYTLNRCLEYCDGEYIGRQDGDDISLPKRFEKEIEVLKNNNYALVSSSMISFDELGDFGIIKHPEIPNANDFRFGSPFCHAPVIIRKKVMDEVNGYTVEDKLLRVEDYHLWFKIYAKGYIGYNIEEPLYKMRDDRNAIKRRNFKNRINETRLKYWGFKEIGVEKKYFLYILKPFIIGLLPTFIYTRLHRKKLSMKQ